MSRKQRRGDAAPTSIIIKLSELAAGQDPAEFGRYVGEYIMDFSCEDGLTTTTDPAEAKRFASYDEAHAFWATECEPGQVHDFHVGGDPELEEDTQNIPMQRFSILMVEVPE